MGQKTTIDDGTEEKELVCPNCGGDEFGIVISQVWWGPGVEYPNGVRDVEPVKKGHIVEEHTPEGATKPMCASCSSEFDYSELEVDQ